MFEVGDVVVAVGSPRKGYSPLAFEQPVTPELGRYYRVMRIISEPGCNMLGLVIDGPASTHPTGAWGEVCFRRIDAPRTEIADRIRACKPTTVTA